MYLESKPAKACNTPQHNEFCLKAFSLSTQATRGHQRPQHTEPTLTHQKDPNTPQHNDVCLKASSQNMQTTTGQQRPDPTLTHTRKIPNTHHDVCLAEIHRACTHPTMNQTACCVLSCLLCWWSFLSVRRVVLKVGCVLTGFARARVNESGGG